jgi:site-specific DNA-methyltransferase (adenine-specific)
MSNWIVKRGDAVEAMRRLPAGSVNLIVTDPPYESLEKHRKVGTTTRLSHSTKSSNDWFPIFPNSRFTVLMEQCHRVLKPNSHCYMFCDDETSDVLRSVARRVGFTVWKRLVWDKTYIGMGYHYRAMYEFILFMEKGKRALNSRAVGDIIRAKPVKGGYPTEKPESVCRVLIEQSTDPGARVLDPFCGSGTVGAAALRLGRRFIGFDIERKAVNLSSRRLQEVTDVGPDV